MKPTADEDQILTGSDALDHMVDTWGDPGQGRVEVEVIGPWFIVRRSGGDYSAFISLVDGELVTVTDPEATTRHIPEAHRPDEDASDGHMDLLGRALAAQGTGMYPLPDSEQFEVGFMEDHVRYSLKISLVDEAIWICEG